MTCQCDVCKYSRKEITGEALKKSLEKDIERFNKTIASKTATEEEKWYADGNKDEAKYMLCELQQESK